MLPAAQAHLLARHVPKLPQLTPQAPQLAGFEVKSRHWPLQSVKPAGHRHLPALHALPPLHASPQPPQLSGSVPSFTQLWPHATSGALQLETQLWLWQNGVLPAQASPHFPQLSGSFWSDRHCPSQLEVSGGQAHAPFAQAWPPAQASPHFPQLSGSLPTMAQACPQVVWPGPEQLHLPPWQTWPLPQLAPHAPQLTELLVKSTQASPQRAVPDAHVPTHWPTEQLSPVPHAWPHAPQLAGSFATLVQLPLQDSCVPGQVAASGPASPASGWPPEQLPPSQRTVGVQSTSCPQMPTELRPQLGATRATNNKSSVAQILAGRLSSDGRRTCILKSPSKEACGAAGPPSKEHASR